MNSDCRSTWPPADADAQVGYRRPPVEYRWKKGVSGNPNGRPRKKNPRRRETAGSLADMIVAEGNRLIPIRESGRELQVPVALVVFRGLAHNAAKGNPRSQSMFAAMLTNAERAQIGPRQSTLEAALTYKAVTRGYLKFCRERKTPEPDLLPHPDEVAINTHTGSIIFNGPVDEREQAQWATLIELRSSATSAIEAYELSRQGVDDDPDWITELNSMIVEEKQMADFVKSYLPDKTIRRDPTFDIELWRRRQMGNRSLQAALASLKL